MMSGLRKGFTVFICTLLLSTFIINGCGKQVDKEQETKTTVWPKEISYCMAGLPNIAFSGDKELYVEDGIMHIRDMESDVSAVLCTHANCSHSSHSST